MNGTGNINVLSQFRHPDPELINNGGVTVMAPVRAFRSSLPRKDFGKVSSFSVYLEG